MKAKFTLLIAMTMLLGLAVSANATLTKIGTGTINGGTTSYNLIYDSGQNITWLDYTNTAKTWQNQKNWASGLTVDFTNNTGTLNSTLTDWRLPTTVNNSNSIAGVGTTPPSNSSQMAYLYYTDLGNTASSGLATSSPFSNLDSDAAYWSATDYLGSSTAAWFFGTRYGDQFDYADTTRFKGIAVMSGNPASPTSPVPEPSTVFLLAAGLLGLVAANRKFRTDA